MLTKSQLSLDKAQQLPGVLLWHASKLWQQALNVALKPHNVSSTSAVILVNLLHLTLEKKQATQARLARLSGIDSMTASAALRTLEGKGLIVRRMSTTDKRAYRLTLTTKGTQTAYAALETIAYTHQKFFEVLAITDSVEAFRESLTKVIVANSRNT